MEQQNIRCLSRECSRQRRSVRQTTGEVGAGNSLLSRWLKYDWTQSNVVPAPPINFLFHSGGCCWLSGNALVLINVVALRRARLVLEWVTVRGYATLVYLTKLPRRNEYWRCSRSPLRKKNGELCVTVCPVPGLLAKVKVTGSQLKSKSIASTRYMYICGWRILEQPGLLGYWQSWLKAPVAMGPAIRLTCVVC